MDINIGRNDYRKKETIERTMPDVRKGRKMEKLKCILASYIVTAIMLLFLAFLLFRMQIGSQAIQIGIIVTYVISTFVGGFFIGRKQQNRKYLWGLLLGCAYFIILILVSLCVNKSVLGGDSNFFTTFLLCAAGGMLGGMVS